MPQRSYRPPDPLSLRATLGPLRHGPGDPTIRLRDDAVWRASLTPEGPATLYLRPTEGRIEAEAWGPGAEWALEGLPDLLGHRDAPDAFVARDRAIRDAQRRMPGLRFCRSRTIVDSLVPTILAQKVTSEEAHAGYARLVHRYGAVAPGPRTDLRLPPEPAVLAPLPYHSFHPLGIERRRAMVVKEACSRAGRLEEAAQMTPIDARARLRAIPGIGSWTAACVIQASHGDPDSVVIGDYHLPNIVSWALAGEPRADDARMLELLEPYAGQRARAVRYLKFSGLRPPRYGPRHRLRDLSRI